MKLLGATAITALILLCGCQRNVSGTYLASDAGAVVWLQLVRTPDDHLTGQLALSKLNADGKIDFDSVAVEGVIGDGNVTLSGSRLFGLQTFSLSGTLDGDRLTLSGSGGPTPFVLKRANMPQYQKQLAILNGRSQAILAARAAALSQQEAEQEQRNLLAEQVRHASEMEQAQRNFVAQIDRVMGDMQRFDSEADVHLGRFPGVEKGYQAITAKVNGYVEQERRLAGNPNASVTRSQLSVAATQASLATDQAHYQGQSLQSSLEINAKPVAGVAAKLDSLCHAPETSSVASSTPEQIEAHNAACSRLFSALPLFRQKYDAMNAGLAHLEQVYSQEKNKQQALLETAQKLE